MNIVIKVSLIVLVVVAVIIIVGLIFLRVLFPPPLSKETTEKDFAKNRENIFLVTDYLINSEYDSVYINDVDNKDTMYTNSGGRVSIDDSQVISAISALFRKGYGVIAKDGNTIHFQRSSGLDYGTGIAYSSTGSEPHLSYLTKLEPLSEPNWYYYEEDVNEWKARNPHLFE